MHTTIYLFLMPTFSQAALNSLHNIRRDFNPLDINVPAINVKFTTRTSQDNFILKPKVILGNLAKSGLISSQHLYLKEVIGPEEVYLHLRLGKQQQRLQAHNQD
jgi:hypothetical protein